MSSVLKKQAATEDWDQWIDGLPSALAEARKCLGGKGDSSPLPEKSLEALMRSFHLIKGSAQALGLHGVQAVAHGLESQVVSLMKGGGKSAAVPAVGSAELRPRLREGLRKLESVLERLHELAIAAAARRALAPRAQNISSLFTRMESVARTIAVELGIRLQFEATGGDRIPLEPSWEAPLEAALLHAIRNSLDHGSRGPGSTLTLNFEARLESDLLTIECADNGKGIDPERVREVARLRHLRFDAEMGSLSDTECLQLLFLPGFSLSRGLSKLSGRGYGLNIVREALETRLNGSARIESTVDQGTRLILRFPAR